MPRRPAAQLAAIAFALALPFVAGAVPAWLFVPAYVLGLAIAALAVLRRMPAAVHATLTLVTIAVFTAAIDLAMRALGMGPIVLVERWPEMPLVNRFVPRVDRADMQYADLAQMIGPTPPATPRARVVTDGRGFRNDPAAPRDGLDVVVLGDSFGAGAASNDDTIRGFLAREHGVRALDLSTPASSPWQEYVNFAAERGHFEPKPGAVLAWLICEGNDLDDEYGPLDLRELPWNGAAAQWLHRARAWRARSPLRYLLGARLPSHDVAEEKLPDGRRILFYKPYISNSARDEATIRSHRSFPALRATLARGTALARERGMRTEIFILPTKEQVYSWVHAHKQPSSGGAQPSGFARALLAACREDGLSCHDVTADLAAEARRAMEDSGGLLFWLDDTHPNAQGNRFIAGRIREAMAAR